MSRQEYAKEQGFTFALIVSSIIHLAVIGIAFGYSFNSSDETVLSIIEPEISPSIEIIFADPKPRQPLATTEEILQDQIELPSDAENVNQVTVKPEQPAIQEQDQLVTISSIELVETERENFVINDIAESETSSNSNGFTSTELNNLLSNYMQSYQQDINQNWLEECVRFKNRNLLKECPLGQEFLTSLNPVTISVVIFSEPQPLASGEFSAQESFKLMTEGDLFNPYLLSGEISLLGTGGGIINGAVGFLANSLGVTQPNLELFISSELEENNREAGQSADEFTTERSNFVIRPALF